MTGSATILPSIQAESSVFDRLAQRQAVRSVGASVDPGLVRNIVAWQSAAPWLDPSALVAISRSGIDPESDLGVQIAKAGAKAKQSSGLGWHSVGDLVSAGAGVVGRGLGFAADEVAKPFVRDVTLGAQSLYQEAQGAFRNVAAFQPGGIPVGPAVAGAAGAAAIAASLPEAAVGGAAAAVVGGAAAGGAALGALAASHIQGHATWAPQSTGGVALEDMLAGKNVDLGNGWLPHPSAALQAQQKANETVTIDGHALTPGRLLAAGVVQPGTTPYHVLSGLTDASLAMSKFDPGGQVLKAAGNVARNSRLFTDAGGLLADRPTIIPGKAMEWWNGTGGRAVADSLAGESNPYQIWKNTGKKLPIDVVRNLAGASTPAEVDSIIKPLLGSELTGKFGYNTFHPLSNVRLAQLMPSTVIDLGSDRISQMESVQTAERWLKNAKAPQDVIDETVSKMINAESPAGRYRATSDLMDATKRVLVDVHGVDPARAAALTKLQDTAVEDARAFNLDAVGNAVDVPGMYLDGQMHGLPQPHLFAEFTNRAVDLPDVRDIRRVASDFAPLLNHPAVAIPRMTLEFVQDKLWKVATLARGALLTRTMGEAQARMAAGGLDSAFNHPASYIAWAAGQKGGADMLGQAFAKNEPGVIADGLDAFNKALSREFVKTSDVKLLPFWRKVSQADPAFHSSWAGELLQMQSDPIAREVARATNGLDAVKQAFWDGNLSGFRAQMAENAGGLASREVADRYIESVADRLATKTGGDGALIDAVGSGQIGGKSIRDGLRPSNDLMAHLQASDVAPEFVKGQVSVADANNIGQKFDNFGRQMFSKLMAEPQNKLVNSPTFKQFYWQRAEQLVPAMSADARTAMIDVARSQGLGDVADRMAAIAAKQAPTDTALSLEHADAVAKGDALEQNWKLLHKLSERGQFMDAAKLAFPFGDAWSQMLHKWAVIGVDHPQVIRRAAQVVQGGQDAGFFYKNAQGQEVFGYPGSGWVSDKLFGVRVPFTGRLDGLSMMTDVLPGVGPVVQVPAGAFLPDKPSWDWARGVLFPQGEPDTGSGAVEAFLPPWLQKMREAGALTPIGIQRDKGQWNGAVMDVARYLSSTGKYDTSSVDGMNHLLDDARSKAKGIYLLRGAAQFVAPSAPTPEWLAHAKDSHLVVVDKLVQEYHDLQAKDPQNATQQMLDKYGDGIFLLLQGKTAEVAPGSVTKAGADWERSHEGVMRSFPEVGGLFAPDGGVLDSSAFQRQMDLGNRIKLTPEQAVRLANNRLAGTIYFNAKDKVGPYPNSAQRDWLSQLRDLLIAHYPGFQDPSGIPQKTDSATMVRQITAAVGDKRLADNPAAQATSLYLAARDKAAEASKAAGLSASGFATAKSMVAMRDWLRNVGDLIVKAHPEFQPIWDRVFSSELVDDTTGQVASG